MPGYTGLEVCERVKRAATTSNMPVLLSVGKLEPYREQDATEARADGVIVKPFEATELVTIVTNVILRASGATIDAATRPSTPPVAMHTSPAVVPEALPAMEFEGYAAEPESLESPVPDAGIASNYGSDTISREDYLGASLPSPVEHGEGSALLCRKKRNHWRWRPRRLWPQPHRTILPAPTRRKRTRPCLS